MNISIFVNQTHDWRPTDYEDGLLNGSEEMVFLFAQALTKIGHKVRVICSTPEHVMHEDVEYIPRRMSGYSGGDILIAFKEPGALCIPLFDQKYLWTADANILTPEEREECDDLVALGPWHEQELRDINPGFDRISHISPGYNPEFIHDSTMRMPRRCLYASSPDRGLDHLLEIWPEIKGAYPDAQLYITYREEGDSDPEMGIFYTGRVDNRRMTHLYRSCDLLVYPCSGGERYCITALKAQMNGCIPVVIPKMALRDTVQVGFKYKKKEFLCGILNVLGDETLREEKRKELTSVRHPNWVEVARQWEAKWQKRSGTP